MESTMELTHVKSINNVVIPTKAAWPVAPWKAALIRPCCERWQKSEDWAFSSALWEWFEWKLFASRGILSGIETCCVDPKAAWYSSSSRPYISVGSTLRKSSQLLCKTQRKGEKWWLCVKCLQWQASPNASAAHTVLARPSSVEVPDSWQQKPAVPTDTTRDVHEPWCLAGAAKWQCKKCIAVEG